MSVTRNSDVWRNMVILTNTILPWAGNTMYFCIEVALLPYMCNVLSQQTAVAKIQCGHSNPTSHCSLISCKFSPPFFSFSLNFRAVPF